MSGTRKALGLFLRALIMFVVITAANLTAFYITAGVALRGDWDRIDNAIARAYEEFLQ